MARLIVVFGAAVHPGGAASPPLRRRTEAAVRAAADDRDAILFLSGGVGRHPPAEAEVMRTLIDGRIAGHRLVLDTASRDTLETVVAAVRFARRHRIARLSACTDRYHQPRVRMLFALFGRGCDSIVPARSGAPPARRWRMRLREVAALPYDLVAGTGAVIREARRPR